MLGAAAFVACSSDEVTESPRDRARAGLDQLAANLARSGAVDPAIDLDALRVEAQRRLSISPYAAATYFVQGLKKGHGGVYDLDAFREASCPADLRRLSISNGYGVCLTSRGDELVVTHAEEANPLGLRPGEIVTRVGAFAGPALDELASVPYCGVVYPSPTARRRVVAWAAMGQPVGTELEVRALDGRTRVVKLSAPSATQTDCYDVFARDKLEPPAIAAPREDVRVVRVGSFKQDDEALLRVGRDANAAGKRVIWDVRGNSGGWPSAATAAASTIPGAVEGPYLDCKYRDLAWQPAAPVGPGGGGAKTAVIVDGGCYSACSHFVRMAKASGAILVGAADAAAYTTQYENHAVGDVNVVVDMALCRDATTGAVAEGHPPEVDVAVEYDPADLAAGRDTVLEAAIDAIAKP